MSAQAVAPQPPYSGLRVRTGRPRMAQQAGGISAGARRVAQEP
jgi:hypothetical protein